MIRGAVFDLDGVLLDSLGIWHDLGARYILAMGLRPIPGMSEKLFSMSMEQGAEYLKNTFRLEKSCDQILSDLEHILSEYYCHEVPAKCGAKELLSFLQNQGVKMVAATSSPRYHVTKALERLELLPFMREIFTTGEVGESKHSPRIYELAASALACPAAEIMVFEDSLYALKTAKNAGFCCAGVYDAQGEIDQQGIKETADIYLRDLTDFIQIWPEVNKDVCEKGEQE